MSANRLSAILIAIGVAVMAGIGLSQCNSDIAEDAGESVEETVTEAAGAVDEAVEDATEAVSDAASEAVDAASDAAEAAVETADEVVAAVTEGSDEEPEEPIDVPDEASSATDEDGGTGEADAASGEPATEATESAEVSDEAETMAAEPVTAETASGADDVVGEADESPEDPSEPEAAASTTPETSTAGDTSSGEATNSSDDAAEQTEKPAADDADNDMMGAVETARSAGDYSKARMTLVDAGWSPRVLEMGSRVDELDDYESALIEAGYAELESCEGEDRVICRFEFLDGAGRIAAVLAAGSEEDPRVIDAFVMKPSP